MKPDFEAYLADILNCKHQASKELLAKQVLAGIEEFDKRTGDTINDLDSRLSECDVKIAELTAALKQSRKSPPIAVPVSYDVAEFTVLPEVAKIHQRKDDAGHWIETTVKNERAGRVTDINYHLAVPAPSYMALRKKFSNPVLVIRAYDASGRVVFDNNDALFFDKVVGPVFQPLTVYDPNDPTRRTADIADELADPINPDEEKAWSSIDTAFAKDRAASKKAKKAKSPKRQKAKKANDSASTK